MGRQDTRVSYSPLERRGAARLHVECPVRIRTPGSDRRGAMVDLSATGARVELADPPREGSTVLLEWLGHDAIATVIWTSSDGCGLVFEKRLAASLVAQCARVEPAADDETIAAAVGNIPLGRRRSRQQASKPPVQIDEHYAWRIEIRLPAGRRGMLCEETMSLDEQMFFSGAPLSHIASYRGQCP